MKNSPWITAIHVAFWLFLFYFFIPVCARAEVVTIKYFNEPESICFCLPGFYDTIIMEYVPEDPEFSVFREIFCPVQFKENWEFEILMERIGNSIQVTDLDNFIFYITDSEPAFSELEVILNKLIRADYLQEQPIYDN